MLTSTLHLLLLIVATLWTANGTPAELSESVISGRKSRQLFMLPHHGPWAEPPRHSSFQHDYYYDGLMNTMGPATQQRLMEALLAVSQRKHPLYQESGFESHLNRPTNIAPSYSKNRDGNSAGHSAIYSNHEFIQLQPRPDIQAFVNQTIQMVITAVVQAIIAQMTG